MIAEAAKLLKGVSLKPLAVGDVAGLGIDAGWLRSAKINAADQLFALVDSGDTKALRPAREGELAEAQVIKVDLASGMTELQGTLLSASPCQVIVPAGYLIQLGYSIAWKKKGCVIKQASAQAFPGLVLSGGILPPAN